jgi:hypothetical protein
LKQAIGAKSCPKAAVPQPERISLCNSYGILFSIIVLHDFFERLPVFAILQIGACGKNSLLAGDLG